MKCYRAKLLLVLEFLDKTKSILPDTFNLIIVYFATCKWLSGTSFFLGYIEEQSILLVVNSDQNTIQSTRRIQRFVNRFFQIPSDEKTRIRESEKSSSFDFLKSAVSIIDFSEFVKPLTADLSKSAEIEIGSKPVG